MIAIGVLTGTAGTANAATRRPDLRVGSLTGVPASIAPGLAVKPRFEVVNSGRAAGRASQLAFWLSRDRKLGKGDVRIGTVRMKRLRPRKRAATSAKLTIPASVHQGRWWLLACADG